MIRLKGAVAISTAATAGHGRELPFVMSRYHQQCGNYGNSGRVI